MLFKFLPLLLLSGFCSTASAALYRITITNTIDFTEDYDYELDDYVEVVTTPYGVISAGSSVTITLTYDTDAFAQVDGGSWSGGSYVQYSTASPASLNITVSSGYNYSGTLGGGSSPFFDAANQYTSHDQVNFKLDDGNLFMQFNDFSGSQTFTSHPMTGQSVEDTHAAFAAAVNSGVMELGNGLPSRLPGMSWDAFVRSYSPATVTLSPVTPVPEPAHGALGAAALFLLFAKRRRAAVSA